MHFRYVPDLKTFLLKLNGSPTNFFPRSHSYMILRAARGARGGWEREKVQIYETPCTLRYLLVIDWDVIGVRYENLTVHIHIRGRGGPIMSCVETMKT